MAGAEFLEVSNPILAGCHPDPSICRVGDDYFLVTSTFEYFPGLPIYHSTDLAQWRLMGHVISEEGQLDYTGIRSSGGLYAPTIRHDGEKFWVVCTLVAHDGEHPGGNFVMTAPAITGPWSEPIWLDVDGIDPSVFFDDDGKVWMHGTRLAPQPQWPQQTETWLREYDPKARALVGPEYVLWRGAVQGAVWSEAPHIYKVDGAYYLLTAEGGTDFHHAVSVARAETVTGPYEGAPTNPIFTHRNLGREYPVVGAGHADLVQAPDGSWWATLLAMRTYGGYHYNLGRETFLVPVEWQDGWPVFAPEVGRITDLLRVPVSGQPQTAEDASLGGERFAAEAGAFGKFDWTTVRGPADFATRTDEGWRLEMRPTALRQRGRPAFLGVRQQHENVHVRMRVAAELGDGEEIGVVVRQSEEDHVRCAVVRDAESGALEFVIVHRQAGAEKELARGGATGTAFDFEISARGQDYRVGVAAAEAGPGGVSAEFDGRELDSVATGGFLGLWFGVYATSNGRETGTFADMSDFVYDVLE